MPKEKQAGTHDITEDSEAYRIGEPVEKVVDHVIEVARERRASHSQDPHTVTEDSEAYRIGEPIEHAVDKVIEVIKERRASQSRDPESKREHPLDDILT